MKEVKDISGMRFSGEASLLQQRSFITGVRPATNVEKQKHNYEDGAWVPKSRQAWRRPETPQLEPFMATENTHPGITIRIVRVAPSVVTAAFELFQHPGFRKDTEDFPIEIVPGVFGNLNDILHTDANMPTTITRDPDREHPGGGAAKLRMGFHLDNKQQLPLLDRPNAQLRAIIHGGGDDRYSAVVVTANAIDIGLESDQPNASFVPNTVAARRFLERHPHQQAVLVEFGQGEALILPHQIGMHDGVNRGKGSSNLIVVNEDLDRRWQPDTFRSASLLHPRREVVYLGNTIDIRQPEHEVSVDIESLLVEREAIPAIPFTQFILPIDQRCNLACDYCVVYQAVDKSFQTKPQVMSDEIIAQAAERIGEHALAHNLPEVSIVLHGGEPTLRAVQDPTFFSRTVETIRQAMPETTQVNFSLQSNAALFAKHPEIVEELNNLGISVGVSLDGDRQANRHRINHAGKASYDDVVEGLSILQQYPDIYGGILCVVDPTTDPIATYNALCSFNPPMIDFNLPHKTWSSEQPPDTQATLYADWLLQIYNQWQQDKAAGTVPDIRMFHSIVNAIHGGESMVETIGLTPPSNIVIETDGTYEKNQAYKVAFPGAPELGMSITEHSLDDVLRHPDIVAIQEGERSRSEICKECVVFDICGSGLCAHRHSAVDVPEKGLKQGFENPSAYCADLKTMIEAIIASEYEATRRQIIDTGISYYTSALDSEFSESAMMRGMMIAQGCQINQQEPKVFGKILMEETRNNEELEADLSERTRSTLGMSYDKYFDGSMYEMRQSFVWAQRMIVLDDADFAKISLEYGRIRMSRPYWEDKYYAELVRDFEHDVHKMIEKKTEVGQPRWYSDWGELLYAESVAA